MGNDFCETAVVKGDRYLGNGSRGVGDASRSIIRICCSNCNFEDNGHCIKNPPTDKLGFPVVDSDDFCSTGFSVSDKSIIGANQIVKDFIKKQRGEK